MSDMGRTSDPLAQWLSGDGLVTLDALVSGAPDVIGVVDRDFNIRYVNWTTPGLTRDVVVGHSVFNLIPPGYTEITREAFDRVLNTGTPASFETMYRGEHGVLIWTVRVGPIRHAGEVIGLVTINTDVTEQRRGEADRDRFFTLSRDMLVVVTHDGRLKRVNPAFSDMLGFDLGTLIGARFTDFVHPDDLAATMSQFDAAHSGVATGPLENRYRRRDGTYRVLSWQGTVDPVTGDGYAVARDITDQRTTEARLRHAEKMEAVGQLAGGIAHDFNNLMQAVLGSVDLALLDDALSPAMAETLREIAEVGQRATDLTRQLLMFSRRQPLHRVPVDLNDLIHGLMKLLRRLIPENIAIEVKTEVGLHALSADKSQLEQVIMNLCVNARDAMPDGGKLVVETHNVNLDERDTERLPWAKPGRFVLLRVADDGAGMPPHVLERAYDPFFTTKESHRGTGLGLATVYGIVQHHGGFIHAQSEVGKGTTFTILLGTEGFPLTVPAPRPPSIAPAASGRETVLVVEDEAIVRKSTLQLVERAGYRTLSAANGLEALELMRKHTGPVDLVLLDVVMPELGGPETWERLQQLRPGLRVLFMSGYADAYRERIPADAQVLEKPFRAQELLQRIRAKLDA